MINYIEDKDLNYYTNNDRLLVDYIKDMIYKSKKIDIIVAFIQLSGIRLLKKEFKYIRDNKIPLRIITGTYMGITDPAAIYMLKDILGDHGHIRFYSEKNRSFHPKSYFFDLEKESYLYIGSSNISRSALKDGLEWNYRLAKSLDSESYLAYEEEFEDIFNNFSYDVTDEILFEYSKIRRKPKIFKGHDLDFGQEHLKLEELEQSAEALEGYKLKSLIEPNEAQVEALYALKSLRESGADKGLVVAATGVGKTYLAAFDTLAYKRVLFLAHRDEILEKSFSTFASLRGHENLAYYYSKDKDADASVVFASVQTLSKKKHLQTFDNKHFDYIVVDEFHHAAASTYQRIINYFNPSFMLGLTATPDRLDNKDIYAICDYNIAYEIDLFEAINKGYLAPYHYYAIYDGTVNYDNISYINGKYVEEELSRYLDNDNRKNLILKNYKRFDSKHGLAFCSSIDHADKMTEFFNSNGISSLSVHSKSNTREGAIDKLSQGHVKILFVVDIFNEGVDIKEIDLVFFLRPTQSPTVFLQQLGRGLRLHESKEKLIVLDFVGNYKKVSLIPELLTGKNHIRDSKDIRTKEMLDSNNYPDGCIVNFDMAVVDIIENYNKARTKIKDLIREEYSRIKDDIGHTPTRVEFFKYVDYHIYLRMRSRPDSNVFNDYISFLREEEGTYLEDLRDSFACDFINMIEKTSMSKLYKLPILQAFYNGGKVKLQISEDDIVKSFRAFYKSGQNMLDMLKDKSTRDFRNWDNKKIVGLAFKNPIKFLLNSSPEFFSLEDGVFSLDKRLKSYINNDNFTKEFKDVIEYKRLRFLKDNLLKKEAEIMKLVEGDK